MTKKIKEGFGLCLCGHPEFEHFGTPSGRFTCSRVETSSGVTTKGIIGEPWSRTYRCDCVDYVQPPAQREGGE